MGNMQERINAFKLLFGFEPRIDEAPARFTISFGFPGQSKGITISVNGPASDERKIECFDACMRRAKKELFYD